MGISHYRMNQLRDYSSGARTLASASYQWANNYLRHWTSSLVGFFAWLQASTPFRFAVEIITLLAVLVTIYSFYNERSAREEDRAHQAWTLVAAQAHDVGNIGLKKALEFLHEYNQDQYKDEETHALSAIKLSGAELHGVQLPGANLNHSQLNGAELSESDLAGASLGDAKLSEAKLFRANLSGAKLGHADLSKAKLVGANLSNASLEEANLSDADLRDADLSQSNLVKANLFHTVLTGVTFDGAILVGVIFTDATVRDEWPETAWFCKTTMPNGDLNNRDCASLKEQCPATKDLLKEANIEDRMKAACNWLLAPGG